MITYEVMETLPAYSVDVIPGSLNYPPFSIWTKADFDGDPSIEIGVPMVADDGWVDVVLDVSMISLNEIQEEVLDKYFGEKVEVK